MKVFKKGILAAMLLGGMVFLSGCSLGETWELLWGNHNSESEDAGTVQEVFDPNAIQVDESVEAPKFSKNLKGKAAYAVGDEAKALEVKAEVEGDGEISYQWYRNTVDSNGGGMKIDGATEDKYTPDTSEEGYAYYFVVATNTIDKSVNMATSDIVEIYVDPDKKPAAKAGEEKPGWAQDKTGWYFVADDGNRVKGKWKEVEGKWYLFNKKGYMLTGWQEVKDVWYYLNDDGSMATGFITVDEKRYFMNDKGQMNVGWLDGDGSWFYSGEDGALKISEWEEIDGSWYYFNEDGVMLTNASVNGKWLNPDGKLAE